MTKEEVFKDLDQRYGAAIQEVLDRQMAEGGSVVFQLGWDFRSQAEIDAEAKAEALKAETIRTDVDDLKARIEALEAK